MMAMSDRDYRAAMEREDNPLFELSSRWAPTWDKVYYDGIDRLEAILTAEQRKQAWPPDGSLREHRIKLSRRIWDE
jgi:hypothetical protein